LIKLNKTKTASADYRPKDSKIFKQDQYILGGILFLPAAPADNVDKSRLFNSKQVIWLILRDMRRSILTGKNWLICLIDKLRVALRESVKTV